MTDKSLTEMERGFIKNFQPDELAKRLAPQLRDLAKEQSLAGHHEEVRDLNAFRLETAADTLRKLALEVYRLRQSIGHFKYGNMSQRDLYNVAETWNDSGDAHT